MRQKTQRPVRVVLRVPRRHAFEVLDGGGKVAELNVGDPSSIERIEVRRPRRDRLVETLARLRVRALIEIEIAEGKYAKARECFDKAITSRTTDLDPFYR